MYKIHSFLNSFYYLHHLTLNHEPFPSKIRLWMITVNFSLQNYDYFNRQEPNNLTTQQPDIYSNWAYKPRGRKFFCIEPDQDQPNRKRGLVQKSNGGKEIF